MTAPYTNPAVDSERDNAQASIYETIKWIDSMQPRSATDDLTVLHHLLKLRQISASNDPMDTKALDQLFSRCISVIERLRPEIITTTLPVPKKVRKLVREQNVVLQLLIDELSSFHDRSEAPIAIEDQHTAAFTLWRILYALSLRLLISHLTAAPAAPGVWRQLHQIYANATRLGISDHTPIGVKVSPRSIYCKALLLSCANPESLSPTDVDFVSHYLDRFVDYTNPGDSSTESSPGFWVDWSSDAAPVASSRKPPPPDTPLHFFAWPQLVELLKTHLTALDDETSTAELDLPCKLKKAACQGILTHLLSTWGTTAKRRYPRRRQNYRAEICTGLDSLWHLLKGSDAPPPETARWMIINESPDGYAAMHISGKTGLVAVGDIAAIRTESGKEWQICIVRRAISENQEHLELGLQILGTHAAAAELAVPDNRHSKQIPVLVLPGIETLGISEMIVTASGLIENKKGELVLVIEKKNLEIREIRTTRVGEQNSLIELFSIEKASFDDQAFDRSSRATGRDLA